MNRMTETAAALEAADRLAAYVGGTKAERKALDDVAARATGGNIYYIDAQLAAYRAAREVKP